MNLRKHKREMYRKLKGRLGRFVYYCDINSDAWWHEQLIAKVPVTPEDAKNLITGEIGAFHGFRIIHG